MSAQFRVKKGPVVAVCVALASVFGLRYAHMNGFLGPSTAGSASVPVVAAMPEANAASQESASVPELPLPSTIPAAVSAPEIRFQGMAWNSQLGLALANGGPVTTKGSIMEKAGVNFRFIREDDVTKQQTQLIAFATSLRNGNPQPTEGAHYMAVMGDGSAATIAGMWEPLKKLGPDYLPEVVGSAGYSRGEDKLMGPPAWKANPKLMRGSLIAGFLRDGDWNIALKFAGDNGIKNNPDEKTWDPEALNWYATDDFIKAGEAYVSGVCEDRPVVRDGTRTGEKKHVCVDGVVTWTPGDVNVAQKKGGLVSIVSTREYRSQMPNTIIGIKKWDRDNRPLVEAWLGAMYDAGDQVKAHPAAFNRASEAITAIFGEQTPQYWARYFKGVVETDRQGLEVELGGSSVNNLRDAQHLYGLLPGSANLFAATYTIFGDLVKQQYPKLLPGYPPASEVLDTSFTENLARRAEAGARAGGQADLPQFHAAVAVKQIVSKRSWRINFDTGRATFTPDGLGQLQELKNGLLVADELAIEIHGHTDDTGEPDRNALLSRARADAVKSWLMQQSTSSFPGERFASVQGHGQDAPIASNDTPAGRAMNRRVDVVLGTTH